MKVQIKLCKDLFKQWSSLDESHFFAERVTGGITNLLLKVSVKEQNGNMVHVTVRLYGPNTEYVTETKGATIHSLPLSCRIWCQVARSIWKRDCTIIYTCSYFRTIWFLNFYHIGFFPMLVILYGWMGNLSLLLTLIKFLKGFCGGRMPVLLFQGIISVLTCF